MRVLTPAYCVAGATAGILEGLAATIAGRKGRGAAGDSRACIPEINAPASRKLLNLVIMGPDVPAAATAALLFGQADSVTALLTPKPNSDFGVFHAIIDGLPTMVCLWQVGAQDELDPHFVRLA